MKDATQLLDLLAAEGTTEIEPTKAAAGRQALYPDVGPTFYICGIFTYLLFNV